MEKLRKFITIVSKTAIIRIMIEPIKFVINGILMIEKSILNIFSALIVSVYKLSLLFKKNFTRFFVILFHADDTTWKDFIWAIGCVILFPFSKIIEISKKAYKVMCNKHKIKKDIREIKRAVLSSKTLLLGSTLSLFVLIGTTLFQIISFFTTYRGLDYYFGDVFEYATLFITLVIQGGLLLLSNASINKQRFNSKRKFMLIFFMTISILFSYTGIMNSQNSPEDDYKKLYDDFYTDYKLKYDILVSKTPISDTFAIDSIDNSIADIKAKTETKIEALDKEINTLYSKYYYNYNSKDREQENQIILSEISLKQSKIDILSQYNKSLDEDKIDTSSITNAEKNNKDISEIISIANNSNKGYLKVKTTYDNLKNELISLDKTMTINDLPDTLGEVYQQYYTGKQLKINNRVCQNYYTIKKGILSKDGKTVDENTAIQTKLNNNKEINNLLYALDHEIQEKFINNEFIKQGLNSNDYDQLLEKAQKYLSHPDINYIALEKLWPLHPDFVKAIGILLVAIFIDGTTVLMPIMMEKSKNSILYAKSRKDLVYEEEDVFEELLFDYNAMNGNNQKELINKLNEAFTDLKGKLMPIPELEDIGYVMYLTEDDFNKLLKGDYAEFFIFSQQCTYIQYMPKEIFEISLKMRNAKSKHDINNNVYLIKGKFIIWLRQNFKELKTLGKEDGHE